MDVRNCRNCGRLFNYLSGPDICPACRDNIEKKFGQVKDYIRENPRASIQQVSEENDVSVQQIRTWIKQERLQFSDDSPVGIECEVCGATIRTGRFCEKCKNKMANGFAETIKPESVPEAPKKTKDRDRMRFLDA